MNDFITLYWPYLVGALLALIVLVVLLRSRGQRVELGDVDPVMSSTLSRREATVSAPAAVIAEGNDLLRIKGLGPKVAARLHTVGVSSLSELAALDAPSQVALDAQLGPFAGRMSRDHWVEQARLLESGDTAAFEAKFGKLG